jgi:ribosomal protein S18 acetylase RimI-like enzyme
VRFKLLELADELLADRIVLLQHRAYAIEAELIGSDRIPPLHETRDELQACGETFLGAYVEGELAGFVSWKRDADTLDIHRLAVDPPFHRRGVGRALVRAALEIEEAGRTVVQTGAANEPAKALYRSQGFFEIGEREVLPGLSVTLFERA